MSQDQKRLSTTHIHHYHIRMEIMTSRTDWKDQTGGLGDLLARMFTWSVGAIRLRMPSDLLVITNPYPFLFFSLSSLFLTNWVYSILLTLMRMRDSSYKPLTWNFSFAFMLVDMASFLSLSGISHSYSLVGAPNVATPQQPSTTTALKEATMKKLVFQCSLAWLIFTLIRFSTVIWNPVTFSWPALVRTCSSRYVTLASTSV